MGDSPEHHEKRAQLYAESKGWKVMEVYHLEAVSGKTVMEHPECQRMLKDIREHRITGLIFSKLARLARNTKELLEFSDIFQQNNADLISLQESIDTSTPAGRLFYTVIAAMAQWEREEIASRVAASVPIRAKLGKPLGGQAPFGYQWKNGKLVPDPKEAPVRKQLYEFFAQHRRKKTVARLLNEAGHRTRNGSKFSDTTVERLLADPTAKGVRRANYTKSLGEGKTWALKPESDWVLTQVEPVVSEDLWNQCNLILQEQHGKNKRPTRKTVHLFSGLAYCACGHKMYVPSNSPKYTCPKCRTKIATVDLEAVFQGRVKDFFFSSDEIKSFLSGADQALKEKEALVQTLQDEQRRTKLEMDKLYKLYLQDGMTPQGFGARYKPLEERLGQIERQMPEVQAELDFLKIQYLSSDEVLNEARDLYANWSTYTDDQKRKIVEGITDKVVVSRDEVTIELCYLPSTSETMAQGQRDFIPALPFCHATLIASRPLPSAFPRELTTLGDHVRQKRLEFGMHQKDVAELLGVDENTVYNWEKGRSVPRLHLIPKVVEFLGYSPSAPADSLGARILATRRALGIQQEALARQLGVDPTTLGRWERNEGKPVREHIGRLAVFLESHRSDAGGNRHET